MEQGKKNRLLINLSIFGAFLSLMIMCFFHDSRAFIIMAICMGYLARNKASTKDEIARREWVTSTAVLLTLLLSIGGFLAYIGYFILTNLPK
jgi:hypothetical protein